MWTIHVVSTHVQGCGPYYTGVWTIVQRGVDYLHRGMDHMIPIVYKVSYMVQMKITLLAVTLPIITPTPHLHVVVRGTVGVVVRGTVGVVVGKGRSWCNSR